MTQEPGKVEQKHFALFIIFCPISNQTTKYFPEEPHLEPEVTKNTQIKQSTKMVFHGEGGWWEFPLFYCFFSSSKSNPLRYTKYCQKCLKVQTLPQNSCRRSCMHRLPPPPLPPVDMAAVPPLDGGQVVVPLGRLLHGRDDPVVEASEQNNWDHTWESHRLWLEQSLSVSELVFILEDGGDGMT